MSGKDLNDELVAGTLAADPFDAEPFDGDEPPASEEAEKDERRPRVSELVILAVEEVADVFSDGRETAYATARIGTRVETIRLRSRKFRSWASALVRGRFGHPVGGSALDEAISVLEGTTFDKPRRDAHIRISEHDGAIWIDLADDLGRAVRVGRDGWTVTETVPVRFYRPNAMQALPVPERGGRIDELRGFLNVASDDALVLAAAWLVAACRPGRPFPILNFVGEQGVGKSTASRVVRSLVDPSAAPIRSAPRGEDDLAVAAVNAHVISYDNLSGLPVWLSDALCRLATGGAISKRALYSDADEVVLDAIRPVILNGIDDLATRSDLADRSLLVTLEPIKPAARRDEERFWCDFGAAAPRIFGAMLDGVVSALAGVGAVDLPVVPRMADFARWATAAEPGLGFPRGAIMQAYERQRARAVDVALDASPVVVAVRELLDQPKRGGLWEGSARNLLDVLNEIVGDERRAAGWPRGANHLSGHLNRARTFLRERGIVVELFHKGHGRWIRLKRDRGANSSSASSASSSDLGIADESYRRSSESDRRTDDGDRRSPSSTDDGDRRTDDDPRRDRRCEFAVIPVRSAATDDADDESATSSLS